MMPAINKALMLLDRVLLPWVRSQPTAAAPDMVRSSRPDAHHRPGRGQVIAAKAGNILGIFLGLRRPDGRGALAEPEEIGILERQGWRTALVLPRPASPFNPGSSHGS